MFGKKDARGLTLDVQLEDAAHLVPGVDLALVEAVVL